MQEALQSYQKAIQIDPNYARAYNNPGVVYLSQMEAEKALADHPKAVKLTGDRALYHVNVGIVLNRLERYSEAVTSCNKAIKLDPGYAKAYDIRADAYERSGADREAERDWETYRDLTKKRKKRRTRRRRPAACPFTRRPAAAAYQGGGGLSPPRGRCGQKINCLEGASGATLVGGYTGREKIQACRGGCPPPPRAAQGPPLQKSARRQAGRPAGAGRQNTGSGHERNKDAAVLRRPVCSNLRGYSPHHGSAAVAQLVVVAVGADVLAVVPAAGALGDSSGRQRWCRG